MGKSTKAKKEKKADFQKTKLRVGKTKAKAANYTDTSFKARSIAVLQQNLTSSAPTSTAQFAHHLGLLNHRSETQRKESLSNLIHALQASNAAGQAPPAATSVILTRCQPLILDASKAVREKLVKLLEELPSKEVASHAGSILLFIRAGMTNLVTGVRTTAVDCLEWLLNVAGDEVVAASGGGWLKTLETFFVLLQWAAPSSQNGQDAGPSSAKDAGFTTLTTPLQGWTNRTATAGKTPEQITLLSKTLTVLALYLRTGLTDTRDLASEDRLSSVKNFPLIQTSYHGFTVTEDPYGYLDLYGKEETNSSGSEQQGTELPEERRKVFGERFASGVVVGLEGMKKEGGLIGRGAKECEKVLKNVWQG